MLGKCFFVVESHNPDLPPETYDELVYDNSTAVNYSTILDWGKYKIVFSGGGGSGAAIAYGSTENDRYANNGSNGEQKTIYLNIMVNETKTISGIIASGGQASVARGRRENNSVTAVATAGNAGIGYANGTKGGAKTTYGWHQPDQRRNDGYGAAGGAGGGSTSMAIDNNTPTIAKGGNGGNARIHLTRNYIPGAIDIGNVSGGQGGSGGVSSGTGASGGTHAAKYDGTATSGAGSNGYIRIYKSNLKPEPL
jgi:hypothetical protein